MIGKLILDDLPRPVAKGIPILRPLALNLLLLVLWRQDASAADERVLRPWEAMDYGPFLTATIEAPEPGTNIAYKGIAINLGANFGGDHKEAVVFDTDLLRYSVGWTGGFVALKGVVFDGEHGAYPRIKGQQVFGNPSAPGWAHAGSLRDPREYPFGPLPKEWAHWRGLWLHGKQVILSYSVGAVSVLEMPALERRQDITAFARNLNLGPTPSENIVQVACDPKCTGHLLSLADLKRVDEASSAESCLALLESKRESGPGPTEPPLAKASETLAAAVIGTGTGARWLATQDGNLRLRLPESAQPANCKILLWRGPRDRLPEFAALATSSPNSPDLRTYTNGGPARWSERLVTHGNPGTNQGPYAIDTLTDPEHNPWHSWLRFGGLDFFPDGKRAALCTWNGDVWIVSGVDGDLHELVWQRIATGLFQPLGLQIVDGQIYVLGRDQITRLHDLNGDGEIDFYENFNNDCMTSEHFHEFALDLKLGPDGNFYYIKCACHGLPASHPHHGTLLRVSRDGSKLEVVARGFRAANGLGVGPHGEFTCIDNQGFWMPGNRINWIQPGGWYGNQWAWNPAGRTNYDEPLCWMHNFVDRSGGTQLWVPNRNWGPFPDEIITISYGMGHMFLLLKEQVNGLMQGAVTRFPLEFETGAMRGVFHPRNGQLYTCGLYGWASNKTKPGGFYRVRYTGKPAYMANELHFVRDGIVLGFTDPLAPSSALDPGNYSVTAWNYHWTANYGSPDFKLNGQEGRDTWPVESVRLAADHRKVFLKMRDVQRVMQVHTVFSLKAADGAEVKNFVHGTIHNLDSKSGLDWLGVGSIGGGDGGPMKSVLEAGGLIQSFNRVGDPAVLDIRCVRLPALFVPAGAPATPFLDSGPFHCRWEGFLKMEINGEKTFAAEGLGKTTIKINGQVVLDNAGESLAGTRSKSVPLRRGLNQFELDYESPAAGDAEFRLAWSAGQSPGEPVPPGAFVHDADSKALQERSLARAGRMLFAENRCAHCHKPGAPWKSTAMPELAAAAPSFSGIGSRLNEKWLAHWLLDPKSIRPDALMPRLLHGEEAVRQAADIAAYLASLRESGVPRLGDTPKEVTRTNLVALGGRLFTELACNACHRLPGDLVLSNDLRVPVGHLAAKWNSSALAAFLLSPAQNYPWTRMPDFKLTQDEAAALTAFLLDRSDAASQPTAAKGGATEQPGNASRGAELVSTMGCLSCHPLDHVPDRSIAPALAALVTADWRRGCMANDTKSLGGAPDFGWSAEQRTALRAFARTGILSTLERDAPVEFAERHYTALRCQACHPRDDQTDLLTQLTALTPKPKAADDDEEIGAGGSVHVGRPPLTFTGEKLYAGWVQRFLEGSLPYKPRPTLQGRMPAFKAYAGGLAEGMAHQHGYRAESAPRTAVDTQLAAIGQRLTGAAEGFSCVSCHDVGSQKALAGKDTATVNFACVAERLRPSYYWRYVQDPPHLLPGTMMPKFIGEDGTTPVKGIFNGDPKKQFTAIWHYLMSMPTAASDGIPAVPSSKRSESRALPPRSATNAENAPHP
ncbi:MAG: c-type cytochrome [Verrucomicrobia bacterium]|nr:c-type cytochrome [Verrucomicrobiota bacterium]